MRLVLFIVFLNAFAIASCKRQTAKVDQSAGVQSDDSAGEGSEDSETDSGDYKPNYDSLSNGTEIDSEGYQRPSSLNGNYGPNSLNGQPYSNQGYQNQQYNSNPFGQPNQYSNPSNPFGYQNQQYNSNPFGQPNQYSNQQNPYGNQQYNSNPYGQQNPYGNQQYNSNQQNPFGSQTNQSNPFGFSLTGAVLPSDKELEAFKGKINQIRRKFGKRLLKESSRLSAIAKKQANLLSQMKYRTDKFSYPPYRADGRAFEKRIKEDGFAGKAVSENWAVVFGPIDTLLNLWLNNPNEKENLLVGSADVIGVAIAKEPNSEGTHYIAILGKSRP